MEKAIWKNGAQLIEVRVLGESPTRRGFKLIQKATAQAGQGMFSVCATTLVLA